MGHPNVDKALRWSQLSKIDMGGLERNDSILPELPGWATSHGATRRARPNDATREKMANGPPKLAQGTRVVTT